MARNAVTVLKMTTVNSSVSAVPTLQAVDTGTGIYVDVSNIDASRMILVFTKTDSGANTSSGEFVTIKDGDSKVGYSAYTVGDLAIEVSSNAVCTESPAAMNKSNLVFAGPFETARFKDSDGYIKVNCTNATNISAVGAILI